MDAAGPPSFSQRLRELRTSAGLTQEQLAERAGLSVKAISALESGRRQHPYPHTLRALAEALGLSESERADLAKTMPERARRATGAGKPARSSLPAPPTPLIGRDRDLAEIERLIHQGPARIITLTGAGGVGKTRLAQEIAWRHTSAGGQSAFVPLAPLADATLVLPSVAQSIGLTEAGDTPVQELLKDHLSSGSWLVVLDNIEHVLGIAGDVAQLVAMCPDLRILATGRAPLNVRAEHEYPVSPLDLPDGAGSESIANSSSVQLFLERAQAVAPSFDLTDANAGAVASICRRLDGLPLALELVAARVRLLSPVDLLGRLDHLLPLLTGGPRDLPERQQTMEAAISWSYDLLQPVEQAIFSRLSVFAGGWTLDAAEQVTAWGDIQREDVIELLSTLVEQSLVVADTGTARFRMLEPIRQYAAQVVERSGDNETLRDRHLVWSLGLVEFAAPGLRGPDQQQWLDRLEQEHDNLRTALAWCQQEGRQEVELKLATGLWRFWETRGYLTEGRRWLDHALEGGAEAPAELRAEAMNAAGNLARDQGDHDRATAMYEASLELRQETGDAYGMAQSLNNLGNVMLDQGKYARATSLYAEALLYFRQLNKEWDIANTLNNLGIALGHRGDYPQATRLLEEALSLRERLGETASLARTLDALGEVERQKGNLDRAHDLHERSLALRRELGDTRGVAIALHNLGLVARYREQLDVAAIHYQESLELRQMVGDNYGIARLHSAMADIYRLSGRLGLATRRYQEALTMQQQTGMSEDMAGSLAGLAEVAALSGSPERAARLYGAAEALRESKEQPWPDIERREHRRIAALIDAALGPAAAAQERSLGRNMPQEMVLAEALAVAEPADAHPDVPDDQCQP